MSPLALEATLEEIKESLGEGTDFEVVQARPGGRHVVD